MIVRLTAGRLTVEIRDRRVSLPLPAGITDWAEAEGWIALAISQCLPDEEQASRQRDTRIKSARVA